MKLNTKTMSQQVNTLQDEASVGPYTPNPEGDEAAAAAALTITGENIFAGLGLPGAEERHARMKLALQIGRILEDQGLTQARAASIMGMAQPDVSNVIRGRTAGFTLDRLLDAINRFGYGAEIVVNTRKEDSPHLRVAFAS